VDGPFDWLFKLKWLDELVESGIDNSVDWALTLYTILSQSRFPLSLIMKASVWLVQRGS
jgi:hypothetical protein